MIEKEYLTVENDSGLDYRTIADIMTASNCPMGHSTVRNIIIRSMEKIAASLMAINGIVGDPSEIAESPRFQSMVASYMHEIYSAKRLGE